MLFGFTAFAANVHTVKNGEQKTYEVHFTSDELDAFVKYIKDSKVERLSQRRFMQKNIYGYDRVYIVFNNTELLLLEEAITK